MQKVYIVDGLRSPIGQFGGQLSSWRPDDLLAELIRALMQKFPSVDPSAIEDVVIGCANQAGEDNRNIARMSLLLAGLPFSVPGETVNRLCASGMSAIINAHARLAAGEGMLMLAGGIESMTRSPWVMSKSSQPFGRDVELFDSSFGWRFVNPKMKSMYGVDPMGNTAENLASLYNISRDDQDLFAYRSQQKCKAATDAHLFEQEILPLEWTTKAGSITFAVDEFPKPNSTLEKLGSLKPAFKVDGSVTAGNSSGLNDGGCVTLLATDEALRLYDLKPLVSIKSHAVVGVEPRIMGIGPVAATQKALHRANLTLDQMDIIELNEAFAAQVLACTRSLGLADDDPRVNPQGGAISLGHPLGMTGARLILTCAKQLVRERKRWGLCTMCIGVGQGYAVVLENSNV